MSHKCDRNECVSHISSRSVYKTHSKLTTVDQNCDDKRKVQRSPKALGVILREPIRCGDILNFDLIVVEMYE